jgi:uroporphyrinogen III methyltransferase/synthase
MDGLGTVAIVGAGTGSLEFLTLRGYQLLSQAEVVVYDALVDEALLQVVSPGCDRIDVGKRGGQPSVRQTEIDRLLVNLCQQGKRVVRLKSGDPFIFGRTTSEMQALRAANCPYEVVPGISSALAAPLLASIPLTDPVMSRCFAVFTAHDLDALDWEALAGIETLVALMGASQLEALVQRLQQHGRAPHTPIAIIHRAGQPQQTIWTGTLQTIVQQTSRQPLSPAVIVIGEVVGLRPYLQGPPLGENGEHRLISRALSVAELEALENDCTEASRLPLNGKTILVTRAAGQSSQFTRLLQAQGAIVLEMPAIEIVPPSSWEGLDGAIAHLSQFKWLVLTSTNGVDFFFERLEAMGQDARVLAGVKIAVVGKKTAACLKQHGLQPDFVPPDFVADSLVTHFPEPLAGQTVLFPRVETGGREVLVQEFMAQGASVTEVPAYQSACVQSIPIEVETALRQGRVDAITFASSKTVQCFYQLMQSADLLNQFPNFLSLCLASIGPQTSTTCHQCFGRVDVEAVEYTLEGLTQAIVEWFGRSKR